MKDVWGTKAQKMMKYWKKSHQEEVVAFVTEFERIIKERGMLAEEFGL